MQNEQAMDSPAYKIPESVLVVIHTTEAEVLLIRRADAGTWQSVTGSKDFEEFFTDTEILDMDRFQNLGIIKNDYHPDEDKIIHFTNPPMISPPLCILCPRST